MSAFLIVDPLFLARLAVTSSGCWEWQGFRDAKGYGRMTRISVQSTTMFTHRYAVYLATGSMPASHRAVCHRCDNPPCCNPDHLFLGTLADNNSDMRAKGRGVSPPIHLGIKHHNATVPDAVVRQVREDYDAGNTTIAQLASGLGVPERTVGDWLHGKVRREAGGPMSPPRKRATPEEIARRQAEVA